MPASFSRRTAWDRAATPLAEALATRRREGREVLDLTGSNPTRAGLEPPAWAVAALGNEAGRRYDPEPLGLRPAREAVAADYARRGQPVEVERIALTASTSESYAWLLKLLCDPGDRILVPRPSYPLFDYLAGLEGVEVDTYALDFDGLWEVDPDAVAQRLTPRTRALFVVSPNNPTGSWLAREAAAALRERCAERGVAIVSDEVFADFPLAPRPDAQPGLADDGPGVCFSLGGLSKSCGLPQLKLGWIAVSGPAAPRREALERLEIVADTYLSVGTPVQVAAPVLLRRREELAAPIHERLRQSAGRLEAALAGTAVTAPRIEGGWSAVLRIPATTPDDERARGLLERRGVLLHPGSLFGFAAGAHLVASLLTPPDLLARGLRALLEDLESVL